MAAPVASLKAPPRADTVDERAGRAISLLYHVTLLGEDSAYVRLSNSPSATSTMRLLVPNDTPL
jgi:hypothetical protein